MEAPPSTVDAVGDCDVIMGMTEELPIRLDLLAARRARALVTQMYTALSQSKVVTLSGWKVRIGTCTLGENGKSAELHGVVVTRPDGEDAGLDPHRIFVNPPLLVEDPSGGVVRRRIDPAWRRTPSKAPQDDWPRLIDVHYRVDPAAVILAEIIQAAKDGGP